jgi:hypothetical protein
MTNLVDSRALAIAVVMLGLTERPADAGVWLTHDSARFSFVTVNVNLGPGDSAAGNLQAEVEGSLSYRGVTATYSASAETFYRPDIRGIDFLAGSYLELSGQPTGPLDEASLIFTGANWGIYNWGNDFVNRYGHSIKFEFEAHIAPGDSMTYYFIGSEFPVGGLGSGIPLGRASEDTFIQGKLSSGDYTRSIVLDPHSHQFSYLFPVSGNTRISADLGFRFTKGGAGTSWVRLIDPTVAATAESVPAAVPEPGSICSFLGLAALFGLSHISTMRRKPQLT